jgi:hypothetical protein
MCDRGREEVGIKRTRGREWEGEYTREREGGEEGGMWGLLTLRLPDSPQGKMECF